MFNTSSLTEKERFNRRLAVMRAVLDAETAKNKKDENREMTWKCRQNVGIKNESPCKLRALDPFCIKGAQWFPAAWM